MKMSQITFTWLVIGLLGFGVFGAITTSYLPTSQVGIEAPVADGFILASLYAGLFLFLLGASVLAGYGWRWRRDQTIYPSHHWPILRQSSLIALAGTFLLALSGYQVLTWWDGVLLLVALILIELSFQVRPPITLR